MFIDSDTKILLLPLPESKRQVKIKDTKYSYQTVGDVKSKSEQIANKLTEYDREQSQKRFEDKTTDEINEEMMKKRH